QHHGGRGGQQDRGGQRRPERGADRVEHPPPVGSGRGGPCESGERQRCSFPRVVPGRRGAVPPSSSASPPPQKPGGTEATPRISEGAGRGQARSIPSTTDRTSSAPPGAASGSTSMVIMVPGSGTNSAASPV